MTQWTAKHIIAQLKQFKDFLTARGAEVHEPTNEYELVRFRSGNATSIVYTKKNGIITFFGEAHTAWIAFKSNDSWRAKTVVYKRKTSSVINTLRKRDGDNCFYCLHAVSGEDESEEHLVPITHGGPDHIANKVLAHKLCNQLAGHLSLAEKIQIHVKSQLKKVEQNEKQSA